MAAQFLGSHFFMPSVLLFWASDAQLPLAWMKASHLLPRLGQHHGGADRVCEADPKLQQHSTEWGSLQLALETSARLQLADRLECP